MKFLKFAIFALAFVGTMASCGAHRAAVAESADANASAAATPAAPQVNHVAKIAQSFGAWTSLKANGSVTIGGAQSLSSSMQMRMLRGKAIYISVRPMGIMEVGRLIIKDDTLLVIDKIHKRYILENAKLLTSGIPVDINTLQDIFLGRAFVLGEGTLNGAMRDLVEVTEADGGYVMRPKQQYKGFTYQFTFNDRYHISSLQVMPGSNPESATTYAVDYSNVKSSLAGYVASKVKVETQISNSSLSLSLNYSGLTWNEEVEIDVKIPANYSRVSGSSLLNMFSAQ